MSLPSRAIRCFSEGLNWRHYASTGRARSIDKGTKVNILLRTNVAVTRKSAEQALHLHDDPYEDPSLTEMMPQLRALTHVQLTPGLRALPMQGRQSKRVHRRSGQFAQVQRHSQFSLVSRLARLCHFVPASPVEAGRHGRCSPGLCGRAWRWSPGTDPGQLVVLAVNSCVYRWPCRSARRLGHRGTGRRRSRALPRVCRRCTRRAGSCPGSPRGWRGRSRSLICWRGRRSAAGTVAACRRQAAVR